MPAPVPAMNAQAPAATSLYRPEFERDSCGFGLIAQMDGEASHDLVRTAVGALERLTHRGAVDADGRTGDGCGLLLKMPDEFFRAAAERAGFDCGRNFALAMVFLNRDEARAQRARAAFELRVHQLGFRPLGWRAVPTDPEVLGPQARAFTIMAGSRTGMGLTRRPAGCPRPRPERGRAWPAAGRSRCAVPARSATGTAR